jgi:hypothetical protein
VEIAGLIGCETAREESLNSSAEADRDGCDIDQDNDTNFLNPGKIE